MRPKPRLPSPRTDITHLFMVLRASDMETEACEVTLGGMGAGAAPSANCTMAWGLGPGVWGLRLEGRVQALGQALSLRPRL